MNEDSRTLRLKGKVVAVTGATGFLGQRIVAVLADRGVLVRAITRHECRVAKAAETVAVGDLAQARIEALVEGVWGVVNCAARVHHRRDRGNTAVAEHDRVNRALPLELASKAAAAGCERFVQISSLAAIRSTSPRGSVIDDSTPPSPSTPYGRSKLLADRQLLEKIGVAMKTISLRPPALLGAGAPGLAPVMAKAARMGIPLPLGRIANARSFMNVENLAESVAAALASQVTGAFVVSDSQPISIADLYRKMLANAGRGDRVWNVPRPIASAAAKLVLGKRSNSLLADCACDGSNFREVIGWTPRHRLDNALTALMAST